MDVADRPADEFETFESAEEKDRSNYSLKTTLLHMESCGINANDHLDDTYVQYGRNPRFVGWAYLGEGGERATATTETVRESETG